MYLALRIHQLLDVTASRFAGFFHLGRAEALPENRSRVALRNNDTRAILVIFEPWCDTYELAPDDEYIFEAISPRPGWLEVEQSLDALTVYAWDGCVGRVYDKDRSSIRSTSAYRTSLP